MSKKSKKIKGGGIVYSTDKETMANLFAGIQIGSDSSQIESEEEKQNEPHQPLNPSRKDKVRVWIDRKSRGGKEVTIIEGIDAESDELKDLATFIKTSCGVGGSVKDKEIIIQGNQRDKVVDILIKKGFKDVKKAGG